MPDQTGSGLLFRIAWHGAQDFACLVPDIDSKGLYCIFFFNHLPQAFDDRETLV